MTGPGKSPGLFRTPGLTAITGSGKDPLICNHRCREGMRVLVISDTGKGRLGPRRKMPGRNTSMPGMDEVAQAQEILATLAQRLYVRHGPADALAESGGLKSRTSFFADKKPAGCPGRYSVCHIRTVRISWSKSTSLSRQVIRLPFSPSHDKKGGPQTAIPSVVSPTPSKHHIRPRMVLERATPPFLPQRG